MLFVEVGECRSGWVCESRDPRASSGSVIVNTFFGTLWHGLSRAESINQVARCREVASDVNDPGKG